MDRATLFAKSVVEGTINRAVGELEILSCKRHLRDIERQGTAEFPYIWSEEKANEIMDFAENLTLAEGDEQASKVDREYPFDKNTLRKKGTGDRKSVV